MNLLPRLVAILKPARSLGIGVSLLCASSCTLPSSPGPTIVGDHATAVMNAADVAIHDSESVATSGQSPEADPGEGVIQPVRHEASFVSQGGANEWKAGPSQLLEPLVPGTVPVQFSAGGCPGPQCYQNEPRISLPTQSLDLQDCPMSSGQPCEVPCPVCEAEIWVDEFLCDGGDRGLPVHYEGHQLAGLETEDTVAEFVDHMGEPHVKPSCRVCIYAPQFASVRSVDSPELGLAVNRAVGAHDGRTTAGLKNRRAAQLELQNDQPIGIDVRSRVSGLDTDMAPDSMAQIAKLVNHVKLINLFEDRSFFQRVELSQTEEAYLAYGLQAAIHWTRDLNPVIHAVDVGGQEVIAKFQAEDMTGIEDKRTPGCLKIIKLADKHTAKPGDVITFTIHFDNVGQRQVSAVRIIDNLTPRLEFIEGSDDSDREGRLLVEDNGEGSLILTFELAEPLPGESGGTLTFQTRVR